MTEREFALNYLDETRDRLLARVRTLDPGQMELCAQAGGWTIAGILEHIVIVEVLALNLARQAVQNPADPSITSVMAGQDELLVRRASSRRRQIAAPLNMHPKGDQSLPALTEQIAAARERTREFAYTSEADLRKHFAPHPMIGPLDCHQWLLLIGAHGERHRAQIEEILAEKSPVGTLRNS